MLFEGPFDSDEASDAVAEIEERDDVASAMAEVLRDFVQGSEEYAEEGCVEASLAITCLVAARISGIAPDEAVFHWLDRNSFTVSDDLRELAAAAFAPATRSEDNHLGDIHQAGDRRAFLDYLEPYRKALRGEPQDPPVPFVPDFSQRSEPWFQVFWSIADRSLPHGTAYAKAAERLVLAVNDSPDWLVWWRPAGLRELIVFGGLVPGEYGERISRGRTTAEAWIDFGRSHDVSEDAVARHVTDDVRKALTAVGRYLGLGPLPPLPALG
ncbi:DUF4259 domain-containing protein [Streptosporangium sp. NPDC006007]|uniref:DUF4259 domain-containing protein n=1 Tax=Streptosporangium sp. NPDC006007 TaxID=3154575 RepID=UPI0033AEC0B7